MRSMKKANIGDMKGADCLTPHPLLSLIHGLVAVSYMLCQSAPTAERVTGELNTRLVFPFSLMT